MTRNQPKRRVMRRLRRKTKWSLPLLSRLRIAAQMMKGKRLRLSLPPK